MLVGHLPFMERLASLLVFGDPARLVVKFQNAGIVALDQDSAGRWFVRWALMPRLGE
jgi:phosphohistidine phosphatase